MPHRTIPVGLVLTGLGWLVLLPSWLGCGTTKNRNATEQLLMSDAVDQAISEIDFQALAGEKVFFDTRYLVNVKGAGFVNSEYIISSLRQQMMAADLRLQEKQDAADFVVEARVGTLGTDGNEIVYGVPANRGLSEAASMIPNTPQLPAIPELSLARKESQIGAVKVAAFAYDRQSGQPIWQSGIARARTSSQDVWVFGAGPFQQGTIHGRTRFAGNDIRLPGIRRDEQLAAQRPAVSLDQEYHFRQPVGAGLVDRPVMMAGHSEPVVEDSPSNKARRPPAEIDMTAPLAAPGPADGAAQPLPAPAVGTPAPVVDRENSGVER